MPVSGFGIHTSIWAMNWTPEAAEVAIRSAVHYKLDFVEIAIGRDYADVAPLDGIILISGKQTLKVSVDVKPVG
jgi:D-psicose/D-tagatose/L-ribulose 3-epimerase